MAYVTEDDLELEGIDPTDEKWKDRLGGLIQLATEYIEHPSVTGLFFEARAFNADAPLLLDGSGTPTLSLPAPALELWTMREQVGNVATWYDLDLAYVVNYNRRYPDDRRWPRLARRPSVSWPVPSSELQIWPLGNQNIELTGVLGFVEKLLVNDQVTYRTPEVIRRCALRLVVGELARLCPEDGGLEAWQSKNVISETTDRHSYTLAGAAATGMPTGDGWVDGMLALHKRIFASRAIVGNAVWGGGYTIPGGG